MAETTERKRVKMGRSFTAPSNNLPSTYDPTAGAVAPSGAEPSNMLAVLARAAADPKVEPAKMRELYAIHKEMVEDENRIAFDDNLAAMQAELPSIARDGRIEVRKKDASGERTGAVQQSSPYATYPNIMTAVQPLLSKYGFGLTSQAMDTATPGRLITRTILSRKGIQRVSDFALEADTTGSKNNAQGRVSSSSYGKRANVILLLNIISHDPKDQDNDGHPGEFKYARGKDGRETMIETTPIEIISEDQLEKLREAIEWCTVPIGKVLEHFGIKKLSDLPAKFYNAAMKDCEDFAARRGVTR